MNLRELRYKRVLMPLGVAPLLWLACLFASAQSPEPGSEQFIKQLRENAKRGDANAQHSLGFYYAIGNPHLGKPSMKEALSWYKKAAEQGLPEAAYKVGFCYEYAVGVSRPDLPEAAKWYRIAADKGVPEAQYKMGLFQATGQAGLPRNSDVAFVWFRKAAEGGLATAQYEVGSYYKSGFQGMTRDQVEALKWFLIAASQGDERAVAGVEFQRKFGGMTAAQIADAERRAKEFVPRRQSQ
ncbi:MAG: tetratricopeptide repeat protein [Verrucomicrobiota bacterium]